MWMHEQGRCKHLLYRMTENGLFHGTSSVTITTLTVTAGARARNAHPGPRTLLPHGRLGVAAGLCKHARTHLKPSVQLAERESLFQHLPCSKSPGYHGTCRLMRVCHRRQQQPFRRPSRWRLPPSRAQRAWQLR
jgi:hypothetical protein